MKVITKKHKYDKIIILYCLMIFVLVYLFPQLYDDLLHGSLGVGFKFMSYLNGRYLGNFFGITTASSLVLRVFIKGIIIISIFYLSNLVVNKQNKTLFMLSMMLFLFIPKEMFREVIVFSAGFANYVIPVLGILYVLHFYFNKKEYKSFHYIVFLALGIFNSLFVEHVTLFNFLLALYILVSKYIKTKKVDSIYLVYFIFSVIGACIMFSNHNYITSFIGKDYYRSISLFDDVLNKFLLIIHDAFYKNFILNFGIIILLSILYKNNYLEKGKTLIKIINSFLWIFGTYSFIKLLHPTWNIFFDYTKYFECILSLLFFISVIYLVLKCNLSRTIKTKLNFYLLSYVTVLGPLLFVNPIASRCYFIGYIFLTLFVIELFNAVISENSQIKLIILIIIFMEFMFYFSIYGYINIIETKRINYINSKINLNEKEIKVESLPYPEYLHGSSLCEEYSERVFRLYYKIDENIKLIKKGC